MHDHDIDAHGGPKTPVTVDLEDLSSSSSAIKFALDEAALGHYVLLTPPASGDHQPPAPIRASRWNAGDVLTTLSGGTALGLIAIALAPASVPIIAAATAAGLILGHSARKLDKPNDDASNDLAGHS